MNIDKIKKYRSLMLFFISMFVLNNCQNTCDDIGPFYKGNDPQKLCLTKMKDNNKKQSKALSDLLIIYSLSASITNNTIPTSTNTGGGSNTSDGDTGSTTTATATTNECDSQLMKDAVAKHNELRTLEGVGLANVECDPDMTKKAQAYADHMDNAHNCTMIHSSLDTAHRDTVQEVINVKGYGENLAWTSSAGFWNMAKSIQAYYDEKKFYHYDTNTCDIGEVCGHYTQVVWHDSIKIGCGYKVCGNGQEVFNCNYYKPGNYIGQKPY